MAFEYGSENRFDDQYFVKGASAVGTHAPQKAGDTNGSLAVVVAAATDMVVSGLKLSLVVADHFGDSYAAPTNNDVLTFGGTSYQAGDILGKYIIPNGTKPWVKPVISGTLTSGTYDVYLQYIAR